jgi:hypothetical protein
VVWGVVARVVVTGGVAVVDPGTVTPGVLAMVVVGWAGVTGGVSTRVCGTRRPGRKITAAKRVMKTSDPAMTRRVFPAGLASGGSSVPPGAGYMSRDIALQGT